MIDRFLSPLKPLYNAFGLMYGAIFALLFVHGDFILAMLPSCRRVIATIELVQCTPADVAGRSIEYAYLYASPLVMQLVAASVVNLWNAGSVPVSILVHSVLAIAAFAFAAFAALRMAGLAMHGLLADHFEKAPRHKAVFRLLVLLGPTLGFVLYRILV